MSAPRMAAAFAALFMTGIPCAMAAGDPARGKEKAAVCIACHGEEGQSISPEFPHLGGQHEQYLLQALIDYKAGRRKNPIMAAQVESLSRQDLSDLAAYFASRSGLYLKR